ncbi:MAG: hypothetical protein J6D54_01600 [Olsenella sp.]|nr:hypothetical protein [Olsenella sp.]
MNPGRIEDFERGFAFVAEGPTERVFYFEYLKWCCLVERDSTMTRLPNKDVVIETRSGRVLVQFNVMGAVSSVPNAASWVQSRPLRFPGIPWTVVLCYDTDGDESLSLETRAWKRFRRELAETDVDVIDLAADADIEDVMLADIEGVRRFLDLGSDVEPHGRKGKAKLKSLYKASCKASGPRRAYKSGEKAEGLIRSLSFEVIEERSPLHIARLRAAVFG